MPIQPKILQDLLAVSGAADHASQITMPRGSLLSFHAQWTGDSVGTIKIYQSNHPSPGTDPASNWVLIPISEVPVAGKEPSGSALESFFNIGNSAAIHYLFVYTHASGSGNFSLFANIAREA